MVKGIFLKEMEKTEEKYEHKKRQRIDSGHL